jgi:2-dehydro-3-deoxygluconokinase
MAEKTVALRSPTVVTLGETMIRLNPPGHQTLEQAETLEVQIGGTESNLAIALQRLGVPTGWISSLPDNPLGHKVANTIRAHGVDVSRVIWTDNGKVGVYFVEMGVPPRPSRIFYDRSGSSVALIDPAAVDWDYIVGARHLHLTGITPALSETCRTVVKQAIEKCQEAGVTISFDVNYRSKLWSPAEAGACLSELVHDLDLLISSGYDIATVFGISGPPQEVAQKMQTRFGIKAVALTLGKDGALALETTPLHVDSMQFTIVDRIGAGDAFDAGLLYGYLHHDLEKGLRLAMAMAVLKHTIPGDIAWISPEQIDDVIAGTTVGIQR